MFFTCHSKRTLEWKGMKSVNIGTSTNDTKRATLAVSVCADGSKLPPMLIIKGTQTVGLQKKSFQNLHMAVSIIARKTHGWMRGQ